MPLLNRIKNWFKQRRQGKKQTENATPRKAAPKDLKTEEAPAQAPPPSSPKADSKVEEAPTESPAQTSTQQLPLASAATFTRRFQQPLQRNISAVSQTLPITLVNRTSSNNVYVYIVGLALNNNGAWFLLQADGSSPYYPASPASEGSPIQSDIGIRLGAPGSSRTVTIPPLAGGRIFVSVDAPLNFSLNPGPALVEPSVTNYADPNINTLWGFCEFTFNGLLYANITYVDFVSIPIGISMTTTSGAVQSVPGMSANGLNMICDNLKAQSGRDGVPGWGNLVINRNGRNIRALSPNSSITVNPNDFNNYFEPYVDQVWQKYMNDTLTIRSFDGSLNASGRVENNNLVMNGLPFGRPSTRDIFSSNSGPFTTGGDPERNRIIPQLAAAFNRTTLLESNVTPTTADLFYKNGITNHYARIVHDGQAARKGYAMPYDDVTPAGGGDESGFVNDSNPASFTVTFGGY